MDKKLEERVKAIEERNKRVEGDKAWETCGLRKVLIILFTYILNKKINLSILTKKQTLN